MISAVIT